MPALSIPPALRASRNVGWVAVDENGILHDANDFFKRLVGRENVVGALWSEWFDPAERLRELPEAHRILAHAEGEYRAEVRWALPPHFSAELDLVYSALDPGNGGLYGPVLVMVLPAQSSRTQEHLRRLLEGASLVRAVELQKLAQSTLKALDEAETSMARLEKGWGGMDKQERAAELTGLSASVEEARKILNDTLRELVASAQIKSMAGSPLNVSTDSVKPVTKPKPYQRLMDRMLRLRRGMR